MCKKPQISNKLRQMNFFLIIVIILYIAFCHRTTFSQWQGAQQLASLGKWWWNWWNSLFLPMFISMPQIMAFSVSAAREYPKLMGQKEQPGSSCVKVRKWNLKPHLDLELGELAMPVELKRGKTWVSYSSLSCNPLKGVGSVQWRVEADKQESFSCNSQNWIEKYREKGKTWKSNEKKMSNLKCTSGNI